MVKSTELAQYILYECTDIDHPVNRFELQIIMYIAQGIYMADNKDIIFEDDFYAYEYCPKIKTINSLYLGYGTDEIIKLFSHDIPHIYIKTVKEAIDYFLKIKADSVCRFEGYYFNDLYRGELVRLPSGQYGAWYEVWHDSSNSSIINKDSIYQEFLIRRSIISKAGKSNKPQQNKNLTAMILAENIIKFGLNKGKAIGGFDLHKYLYIIQGIHLAKNDCPLFEEDFRAVSVGGEIRSVYEKYLGFGASKIRMYDEPSQQLTVQTQEFVIPIINILFELNGFELSGLVCAKNSAWYYVWDNKKGHDRIIDKELIKEEFRNRNVYNTPGQLINLKYIKRGE